MTDIVAAVAGALGGVVHSGAMGSVHWNRLSRLSDRLVESIGSQHLDSSADTRWYVPRDIESSLLERLSEPAVQPQIVVGEAGHGKSTLLWSLHRALGLRGRRPVVVSASWLQRSEDGSRITSTEDIADAVLSGPGAVLLLDTADLLLHSESTRLDVIELLDRLARAAVPVVATTRPQESAHLPPSVGDKVHLRAYSIDRELPAAIYALTGEFCTDDSAVPTDSLRAITSARARGLLVDAVCTSPLLLRLLFSLSAPQFPHLELDVNGLYSTFWARRVTVDHRAGPIEPVGGGDDFTDTAGWLAIAMLALGTPEPHIDDLVRRAAQAAAASGHPSREDVLRSGIRILIGRGVLLSIDDRVRFFHQTFFEFAAAKGLTARGRDAEVPRLIERITAAPDDLFVGAVLEQTLIMLGTDALARPTVEAGCQVLLDSGHHHLVSLALTVWAHHPSIVRFSGHELASVTDEHLRRFLRTLPRVHSHTDEVAHHLSVLWILRPRLRTAITTTAASLAGRDPESIADLVRESDMYTQLAASHHEYMRSNSEPRTLLRSIVQRAPTLVREAILTTIDGLADPATGTSAKPSQASGKQTIARYLHLAADLWNHLGDSSFLDALARTITDIQTRSGDSDADTVRDSFAVLLALDLEQRLLTARDLTVSWIDWVGDLCVDLEREGGDRDPIVAARLIALGTTMRRFTSPDHADLVAVTFAKLFTLTGRAAPRQLARGALTQILTTDTPSRDALIPILASLLDGHLPAEHNNSSPGNELWAAVTRQAIWDTTIPVDIVHRILAPALRTYAGNDRLFTTGNHLVALAPTAIVWGEPCAVAAARTLAQVDESIERDRQAANTFVHRAAERAHQNPDRLVALTVAIARTVGRTATVKALLSEKANQRAIDTAAPLLRDWIEDLLTGDDRDQRDGADLLRQLHEHGITTPTLEQVMSWLHRSTSPEGTANLLTTISMHARQSGTSADAADLFRQYVTTTSAPHPAITAGGRSSQPVVIEAARTGLLECIAVQSGSFTDQWQTVHALTFAPRLHGAAVDVAGIRHLARFVRNEAQAGHIDDAIAHLDATCTTLASLENNLRVKASNKLKGAVAAVLRRAESRHYDALARLIHSAPKQTSTQLIHGLLGSAVFAERAREFGGNLQLTPRVIGIGTFPEILSPPGPAAPPTVHGTFGADPVTESAEPSAHADRAARVIDDLDTCTRHLERMTDDAYHAIRTHIGAASDGVVVEALRKATGFHTSGQTIYRLKSGSHWRRPSQELCTAIDDYGSRIGRPFGLTKQLRDLGAAKQADDDMRNARR